MRHKQRRRPCVKTLEGLGEFWRFIAVSKRKQVCGVLGSNSRIGAGLSQCAGQHRQRSARKIRKLPTEFLLVTRDQSRKCFDGIRDDIWMATADPMHVVAQHRLWGRQLNLQVKTQTGNGVVLSSAGPFALLK